MIALLLFGSFFLFLGLGIPVAFALGLSAVVTLVTDVRASTSLPR